MYFSYENGDIPACYVKKYQRVFCKLGDKNLRHQDVCKFQFQIIIQISFFKKISDFGIGECLQNGYRTI